MSSNDRISSPRRPLGDLASIALCTLIFFCLQSSFVLAQVHSQEKTIVILAAGDIADCRKASAESNGAAITANMINKEFKKNADSFVISLGDHTYPAGAKNEFQDCYDKSWGHFRLRTLPTPGNHEYGTPKAQAYFSYFGDQAGDMERSYYAKQIGTWRLLSLNSNLDGAAMQAQVDWLRKELVDHPASCTLAFWHHPRFSSGGHGNNQFIDRIWQLLANANADLVLSAHDHNYERIASLDAQGEPNPLRGVRSFVIGTGGASLTPMFFPKSFTEIRQNDHLGVLKLRLFKKSYDWEFLAEPGANFTDRGQASCH